MSGERIRKAMVALRSAHRLLTDVAHDPDAGHVDQASAATEAIEAVEVAAEVLVVLGNAGDT